MSEQKVPYRLTSLQDVIDLAGADPLFLDTETVGFYGTVRLLQAYVKGWDEVLMVEWPDPNQLFRWVLDSTTIWHNAHYDITTLQVQTGSRSVPDSFHDTFFAARLHYVREESFSLDSVLWYLLGYCPYTEQGLDKKLLQKSDWSSPDLTPEQLLYAATDVYHMPALWDEINLATDDFNYKLDIITTKHCLDFQNNGLPIDFERIAQIIKANKAEIAALNLEVNSNSPAQVCQWLGIHSSAGEVLAEMALSGGPRAEDAAKVRQSRKLKKQISFLNKFIREAKNGRIFGKFKPSARSGRLTSNDMNLQQTPRALKQIIQAPDGYVFIRSDYSQLELRAACVITNEQAMARVFRSGEDIHNYTAQMLFGTVNKMFRQISKGCNFNLLYGGSHKMLGIILMMQADLLLDEGTLFQHKRKWKNLWSGVAAWQERGIVAWRAGRTGSTPLGRQYKSKRMTDHLNIEVQGFGAEIAKLGCHYMRQAIGDKAEQLNFVHDDYLWLVKDDPAVYKPICQLVASSMQEAWTQATANTAIPDLPMPVEVTVGRNVGDMEADIYDYRLETA